MRYWHPPDRSGVLHYRIRKESLVNSFLVAIRIVYFAGRRGGSFTCLRCGFGIAGPREMNRESEGQVHGENEGKRFSRKERHPR